MHGRLEVFRVFLQLLGSLAQGLYVSVVDHPGCFVRSRDGLEIVRHPSTVVDLLGSGLSSQLEASIRNDRAKALGDHLPRIRCV